MTLPRALAALLVALLALPACDTTETFTIGGTYSGSATVPSDDGAEIRAGLSLTIPETDSGAFTISSGRVSASGLSINVTGSGTYTPPNISITLDSPSAEFEFDAVSGVVSPGGDRIVVQIEGAPLVLTRE